MKPDPKRPQLWLGFCAHDTEPTRFRIIYPDGRVEYSYFNWTIDDIEDGDGRWWSKGCTSRKTMEEAKNAAEDYDASLYPMEFVSNLQKDECVKRADMILKMQRMYAIRHVMLEGKYITLEQFMDELLSVVEEQGMLPPKAPIKMGQVETHDYYWETK